MSRLFSITIRWVALSVLTCVALLPPGASRADPPPASPWVQPEPGSCTPEGGLLTGGGAGEGVPLPFAPGDVFGLERVEALKGYLPDFLWEHRERFFFEGMRLEIGPCFRDYSPPDFFRKATQSFGDQPRLLENGGLESYTAGLPFPPEKIAPDDAQAGLRWLWNVEHRYQAAGFRGRFRMSDLLGRVGRAEAFEGEMFKILLSHRSDQPAPEHEMSGAKDMHWVAGGLFFKPFAAREYAWRQFRHVEHEVKSERSDDLHAYLPQWRRVRRINANQVEGLYMPSFSVGVQPSQQLLVGGGGGAGAVSAAGGGVGGVGGTIEAKRSGFEGLELRPMLYRARVVGLQDVLTPINMAKPMYPVAPDRDFGPWGLSFADDRWDLRRALILEATRKDPSGSGDTARMILFVDLETLQPLYMATHDTQGELTNVGIYANRWSEDRPDYPRWPDDEQRGIRVLDSVGAAFANLAETGSWRRESWENSAIPPKASHVKRMISVGQLTRRR